MSITEKNKDKTLTAIAAKIQNALFSIISNSKSNISKKNQNALTYSDNQSYDRRGTNKESQEKILFVDFSKAFDFIPVGKM